MGLGIVLIFWLAVGGTLAAVAGAIFAGATAFLTRDTARYRRRAILLAAVFPFVSGAWFGAIFLGVGIFDSLSQGRDMGIGDAWVTPLPNGYTLAMIDVTDNGSLCRGHALTDICPDGDDLDGVNQLQLYGPYMAGTRYEADPQPGRAIWFLFDTRDNKARDFSSEKALAKAASAHGFVLHLEPIFDVYETYRWTWIDITALLVAVAMPALAFLTGLFWVLRLRTRQEMVTK